MFSLQHLQGCSRLRCISQRVELAAQWPNTVFVPWTKRQPELWRMPTSDHMAPYLQSWKPKVDHGWSYKRYNSKYSIGIMRKSNSYANTMHRQWVRSCCFLSLEEKSAKLCHKFETIMTEELQGCKNSLFWSHVLSCVAYFVLGEHSSPTPKLGSLLHIRKERKKERKDTLRKTSGSKAVAKREFLITPRLNLKNYFGSHQWQDHTLTFHTKRPIYLRLTRSVKGKDFRPRS